jgi:NADH-quinone oxidoreductase subunit L
MILSTIVGLLGLGLGYMMYGPGKAYRAAKTDGDSWLYRLVHHKYYIDELYGIIIVKPLKALGSVLTRFDQVVVDGIVRLCASAVTGLGRLGSRAQNGQVQVYGLVMLLGLVALLLVFAGRRLLNVW